MHEISVASQVLALAREHAAERGADRIDRIEIAVGRASHVNPDQLSACLSAVAAGTMAADAAVAVDPVDPYAECDCGWAGEPDALERALAYAPDLSCPDCGTRLSLTRGDGCHLLSIRIPDDDATDDSRPRQQP